MILYNLRHAGDQYRITKLTNGEVASSYLCTPTECQCPRGEYPTCRHRQMLPFMLNQGLCDSEWFLDWDGDQQAKDLHGHLRSESNAKRAATLQARQDDAAYEAYQAQLKGVASMNGTQPPQPTPFRRRL